tara:strand:- start:268 stop:1053 length:786 start_codon:yes stop_codon:yes gene_type:complete
MATLTYDPTEQTEGELSTEEKESLEVGEKLAEQQEQMLAGKFKTAEDLEQGYIELQKKLGEPKEEKAEAEPEQPEAKEEEEKPEEKEEKVDTAFLDTLWEEAQGEKFTKETLSKLEDMKPQDVAQMYLEYRAEAKEPQGQAFTEENIADLKGVAGGDEGYTEMMGWAKSNLKKAEVDMYDQVMDQGNPLAAFFAVQALKYRFDDAKGVDGEMLQGKAPKTTGDTFKSQAQVVKAMSDPQYDKDPAYRQAIYDKLERSNLEF